MRVHLVLRKKTTPLTLINRAGIWRSLEAVEWSSALVRNSSEYEVSLERHDLQDDLSPNSVS